MDGFGPGRLPPHRLSAGRRREQICRQPPQTEDNNAFVPDYYTVGLDVTLALDMFGLPNSNLRFNADNLLNKHYFSSIGTQTCWQPVSGFNGCTNYPTAYVGSPQSFQVTLTARY